MLKNLKSLIGQFAAFCRLEAAIVEELEEQSTELSRTKELAKLNQSSNRALAERVSRLEKVLYQKVKV